MPGPPPQAQDLEELYARAVDLHGHLCPGVILGTRMAVVGMQRLGLAPGAGHEGLVATVETVRCATDAVQSTTRCSPGRRSLRVVDHGKMAATFALPGRPTAVRVFARESSREAADRLHPEVADRKARQVAAYREMRDGELFEVTEVRLLDPPVAGHKGPRPKSLCPRCGESFQQSRGVEAAGDLLCGACAGGAYFAPA